MLKVPQVSQLGTGPKSPVIYLRAPHTVFFSMYQKSFPHTSISIPQLFGRRDLCQLSNKAFSYVWHKLFSSWTLPLLVHQQSFSIMLGSPRATPHRVPHNTHNSHCTPHSAPHQPKYPNPRPACHSTP